MDIFSKLNSLKSIEPSENWVFETRKAVLSEAPIFEQEVNSEHIIDKKSILYFDFQNLFASRLAISALSMIFVLFTGVFAVSASKSSLPGDFLYSIKIINENMALAVAPEEKKATIEIEHAGKRLEEIAKVSQKTSDVGQKEKIEQLVEKFEEKVISANSHLTRIDKSGEKGKVAKVINTQSEKYTEVLAKTTESLPTVVKNEISDKVAKALDSSEKASLNSLTVMVEEMTDDNKEEITAKVNEKVEGAGESVLSEEDIDLLNEENEEDGEESDTILEIENNTEESTEEAKTIEKAKEELIKLLDDLSDSLEDNDSAIIEDDDSGSVSGASVSEENIEEGSAEEIIIKEEPEEAVIKEDDVEIVEESDL